MSTLVHCIYTSCQSHPMSSAEIDALLRHSHESNARHGITGILLYAGGCFMQVLEGDAEYIDMLYAKILIDPRHTRITRIILEAIPRRFFGEWTMGLSHLTVRELAQILDGGDLDQREDLLASVDEGRAKKLLRAFAEGRWRKTLSTYDTQAGHVAA